jgi:hypothetical protein
MNEVPVANQGEDEQQKGDQKQAGGLGGVYPVPRMLMCRVVLALSFYHEVIVRRTQTWVRCECPHAFSASP